MPQVVAASFAVSTESGEIGSLVKLLRVLAIGPVVAGAALLVARSASVETSGPDGPPSASLRLKTAVPWFVAGFLLLAVLRTMGLIPDALGGTIREVSRAMTIVAMAALGLTVDLASVRKSGRAVATLVLALTVLSIGLGLVLVSVFGV